MTEPLENHLMQVDADRHSAEEAVRAIWPGWRVSVAHYTVDSSFDAYIDRDDDASDPYRGVGPPAETVRVKARTKEALVAEVLHAREEWRLRRLAKAVTQELTTSLRQFFGGGR